jgi:phenylpropionate dioxygenase-like ring-hydroxylating dioxygenase large terminal subunit
VVISWADVSGRHRAFPIVQKPSGNASILACKYHGWSYGLDGRLAKAPSFTNNSSSDFDPSFLHLFPVHVHVDRNGFVYVNLDAKKQPDISWENQYGKMDEQDALVNSGVNWDNVEYDFTWICDGKFNWKLMQENYNEVSCLNPYN